MIEYEKRACIIGTRIRKEREALGLNKKELLTRLYMSEASHKTLTAWESGLRLPDLDSIARMAELFDCDTGYLLGDYDERRRVTADVCKETGLSEGAVEWVCGLRSCKAVDKSLSKQLLDALSVLITTEDFSLVLRDIVRLKIIMARAANVTEAKDFSEIFERMDYLDKVGHEVPEYTGGKYLVLSAKQYAESIKFLLNKEFNNIIDEISEGAKEDG